MKTHTPPTPFHSLKVEKRLALGLLAQPQNKNKRKSSQPDNGSDALLTLTALTSIALVLVPIILFLSKR